MITNSKCKLFVFKQKDNLEKNLNLILDKSYFWKRH